MYRHVFLSYVFLAENQQPFGNTDSELVVRTWPRKVSCGRLAQEEGDDLLITEVRVGTLHRKSTRILEPEISVFIPQFRTKNSVNLGLSLLK